MEILEAVSLARKMLNEHGFGHIPVELSRGKNILGYARSSRNVVTGRLEPSKLCLSRYYIALNDESHVRQTILHEIAHLKTPGHNHDYKWKMAALALGCDTSRVDKTAIVPKGNIQGNCPKCGMMHYRHRAGKHVKTRVFRCICGGRFTFNVNPVTV